MSKILTSEQQYDLRNLLENIRASGYTIDLNQRPEINYWCLELKPKRTRKVLQKPDNSERTENIST